MNRRFCNQKNTSVVVAKHRLHQLLSSDRLNCSPVLIGQMKHDIFQVVSKYMELEPDKFEMVLTRYEMYIKYTGEEA